MRIEEQIKTIIEDKLGVEYCEITDDADLRYDLGADSIDMVELVMEFEHNFEISIDEHQVEEIETVGELTSYIVRRIASCNNSFIEEGVQKNYVSQPEIEKKSNNYVCQPDIKFSDYNE